MNGRLGALVIGAIALSLAACGAPQGPHVRFARASAGEIHAAEQSGQVVWYDFDVGDEVPLVFGLVGVSEAFTDPPARMVAQRPFSIVVFPDGRTMFSFDGHSLTSGQMAARWSMALGTENDRGRAALILYIGRPQDIPPELRR
jgi:hypothetical protein